MLNLSIAGLQFLFEGPSWLLHENCDKFYCNDDIDGNSPCIQYRVIFSKISRGNHKTGTEIFKKGIRSVISDNGDYHIFYNEKDIPSYIKASDKWTDFTMYLDPTFNDPSDIQTVRIVRDGLFAAIRNILISTLVFRQGVLIHSASMEWNGQGIVFSAPSGTGKSTHTNLWHEKYGVEIIDGDVAACRIENGKAMIYGLPWCGTSGIYTNKSLPLGSIFFLEQSKENSITKLDSSEAIVRLYSRCFLFTWEEEMADRVLDTIREIVEAVGCYQLKCRPDFEAVELVKQCLDKQE